MSRSVSPARAAAIWVLSRCRRFDAWTQQTADSARTKFSLSDRDAALCLRLCRSVLQNAALLEIAFVIDVLGSPGIRNRSVIDRTDTCIGDLLT